MNWYIKKFNELSLSELYSIVRERINVFVVEQNCPYPECDDKDIDSYHLMLKEDDKLVAYLRIIPPGISFKETSIGRVLVCKDYRGKGLARELLTKALNFIQTEMKQFQIKISAQKYLIDFYKSFGFKIDSEVYLEDGIPHVDMVCEKYNTTK